MRITLEILAWVLVTCLLVACTGLQALGGDVALDSRWLLGIAGIAALGSLGLALGIGTSLLRIERAARGEHRATSLRDLATQIENRLAPARIDALIEARVAARTRDLEERCRRQEELLSNTAHELRTPLTVMMASIGMLRDEICETEAESQEAVECAHAAGQHLIFVINDLVDTAAADAGRLRLDLQQHPVGDLLDDVDELVMPIAEVRGIHFVVDREAQRAEIVSDRVRMLQIVFNLVGNSFKFSAEGTEVELRTAVAGDVVRFEVHDRGIGVAHDQRDDLFQRFSRVHDPRSTSAGGTGLGLHICKLLVDEMGGRIGYREREGGPGSVFWFELPRAVAIAAVT